MPLPPFVKIHARTCSSSVPTSQPPLAFPPGLSIWCIPKFDVVLWVTALTILHHGLAQFVAEMTSHEKTSVSHSVVPSAQQHYIAVTVCGFLGSRTLAKLYPVKNETDSRARKQETCACSSRYSTEG